MSVARGFGLNGKSIYSNVAKLMEINLNFIVDSTNGNGLGLRSLKSNGYVRNVFMHTTQTPGVSDGVTNPNPLAGYALIQLENNFNYYLGGFSGFVSPTVNATTSTTSGLTPGQPYIITVLGTTTLAEWQAIGLPAGLTPTVGQSFIATATGTGGSHTGKVGTPSTSGITSVEVVGNPNASIANSNLAANGGAYLLVQFVGMTGSVSGTFTPAGTNSAPALTMNSYTPAGTITNGTPDTFTGTPATLTGTVAAPVFTGTSGAISGTVSLAATAPANGSVVGMNIRFDGSSVTVDGI